VDDNDDDDGGGGGDNGLVGRHYIDGAVRVLEHLGESITHSTAMPLTPLLLLLLPPLSSSLPGITPLSRELLILHHQRVGEDVNPLMQTRGVHDR